MRYSVNDGPGIRTTVFLKGCPLKCKWCHNPESISRQKELILYEDRCIRCDNCLAVCRQNAIEIFEGKYHTNRIYCLKCGECVDICFADARVISGQDYTVNELMTEIEKDIIFYDESKGGVTFSGGEPLLQHEFLLSVLQACKNKNIHTAIDTSGYTTTVILEQVSRFTNIFLFDLKTLNDAVHKELTGVSNHLILNNLKKLVEWNKEVVIRIPLIPGINDNISSINEIGEFISSLGKIKEAHILPYHKTGIEKYVRLGMEYQFNIALIEAEKINILVNELVKHLPKVLVGG